jgi:hypothetical protein
MSCRRGVGRKSAPNLPIVSRSLEFNDTRKEPSPAPSTYLVFGDLHGRVPPALKLAQAWSREHGLDLSPLPAREFRWVHGSAAVARWR